MSFKDTILAWIEKRRQIWYLKGEIAHQSTRCAYATTVEWVRTSIFFTEKYQKELEEVKKKPLKDFIK